MGNRYDVQTIKKGAFPRPLKDSQVRGMIEFNGGPGRRNPKAERTLLRDYIEKKRQERRIRSTKHRAR